MSRLVVADIGSGSTVPTWKRHTQNLEGEGLLNFRTCLLGASPAKQIVDERM